MSFVWFYKMHLLGAHLNSVSGSDPKVENVRLLTIFTAASLFD